MSDTQILPVPPTALLKAVHAQMRELFARYNALGPDESRARKAVFEEIQEGLVIHMEIEEILFYPAVQHMKQELAISVVLKALTSHAQVKELLAEIRVLITGGHSLHAKMGEFQACVLTHLQAEEAQIFPHARALPLDTQEQLSREMEQLRIRLLGKR